MTANVCFILGLILQLPHPHYFNIVSTVAHEPYNRCLLHKRMLLLYINFNILPLQPLDVCSYVHCLMAGTQFYSTVRLVCCHVHLLLAGTRLYSTVYAFNGAGLKSAGISSDGVVIDSTPPLPLHKFKLGKNLLKNPSFEEDAPISGTQEAFPQKWSGSGRVNVTTSSSKMVAQDKHTFVDITSGYIEQTVRTVRTNKYRISFHVHSPNTSHFHSHQIGFIRLPGFRTAFVVEPTVATSGEWQKHVYYFIAIDSSSSIRVGAVGHKTGFLLDNVQIQEVGDGHRSLSTDPRDPVSSQVQPMHVHVMSRGSYSAVTAAWDVEDPESPVTGYSWAIGTVRGE